ncbi:MAG TPA: hypothetical protein VFW03_19990 [Gemmatimonadaceae bacterium]|nr:hypothetical protein [Gemmatimonadaceae bacterium]
MLPPSALVVITFMATPFGSSLTASGCTIDGSLVPLLKVPEASGVAFSARTPGVAWTHNDSSKPIVYALSDKGALLGSVHVTGAEIVDWEDIAVAPCPGGSCLYIADIGDNRASRSSITIYRTPEPAPDAKATDQVETLHAKYPDRPRDAEALIVLPKGDMFVVTKGEDGPSYLYRVPTPFRNGATVTLEWIGHVESTGGVAKGGAQKQGKRTGRSKRSDRITGAGASPDGRWVVLRTHGYVSFFAADEFVRGTARQVLRFDVTPLQEPQGEGIAIANNGALLLVGEGGGKKKPGTFARASCTLPPPP